ncbi:MAG: enoyl-CoA hydratase-related protein [Acetobacterales bacterium]
MDEAPLLVSDDRGLRRLTLNRPDRHNAFDDMLVAALSEALDAAAADASVRAVVLSGAGPSFCAGADIGQMRRCGSLGRDENIAEAASLGALMQRVYAMPRPVIALVHGAVYGGGTGLVAAADIAVADASAKFRFSEVALGLVPGVISPYILRAIGERQAGRLFLTAEPFGAEEARRIGLVHEVVPEGGLEDRLAALAKLLGGNAPGAMASAKSLIREVAGRRIDSETLAHVAGRLADARMGREGQEGLAAFIEKRRPDWKT